MNPYPKPILFPDFNALAAAAAARAPILLDVTRATFETSIGSTHRDVSIGAVEVALESVTTGRASPQTYTETAPHAPVGPADARFCFAPGRAVEQVDLRWRHTGEGSIAETHVELFCLVDGAPTRLFRKVFRWDECPRDVRIEFDGNIQCADPTPADLPGLQAVVTRLNPELPRLFPGDHVTVERSPYQVKVSVVLRAGAYARSEPAWTYFDVRPAGIALTWCDDADLDSVLPNTNKDRHAAVCRSLADAADANNLNGAIPPVGQTKKVYLKSNIFYRTERELTDITYYERYRQLWGDGPCIPILATIQVKRSDGTAVDAPLGVGNVKLMWEWVDQGDIPWPVADANNTEWMDAARDYWPDETPDSPAGRNCHTDRGGKRGRGGRTCFPAQTGKPAAAALPAHDGSDDMFPFRVDPWNAAGSAFTTHRWAAYSHSWAEGRFAGKSGILFQPSRMAGDGYDLRVYLAYDTDREMETSATPDTIHADLRTATGTFQIWREVDVVKHWRLRGAEPRVVAGIPTALDLRVPEAKFRRYYVRLNQPDDIEYSLTQWWASLAAVAALRPGNADHIWAAVDPTVRTDGLLHFREYGAWRAQMLLDHGPDEAALLLWAAGMQNGNDAAGNPRMHIWEDALGNNGQTPISNPWPAVFDPFEARQSDRTASADGTVVVEFPGVQDAPKLTILFDRAPGAFNRDRVVDLSPAQRAALKDAVDRGLNNHRIYNCTEGNPVGYGRGRNTAAHRALPVKLSGRIDQGRRVTRLNNVRDAILQILNELSIKLGENNYANPKVHNGWTAFIFDAVLEHAVTAMLGATEGLVVAEATRLNNKTSINGKSFFANAAGNRAVAATLAVTPKLVTLEHEFGHAMFLNHTFHTSALNDRAKIADENDPNRLHQLSSPSGGKCVMSRIPSSQCADTSVFCAFCVARLWGWSFVEIDAASNQPPAAVGARTRTLFPDPAHNSTPPRGGLGDAPRDPAFLAGSRAERTEGSYPLPPLR